MRTRRTKQGSINSIPASRWTAYAAAAASTVAGLGSAEAEIHYSGNVSIELTGNAHASLPLSSGAALVFANHFESTFVQTCTLVIKGAVSGSLRGERYFPGSVRLSRLPRRSNISAGGFLSATGGYAHGVLFIHGSDGQFAPYRRLRGFVGFRFNIGKGMQYGWVRIQAKDINDHAHEIITDYAWGDAGDTILTGQKESFASTRAKPVFGSLGLLALGAKGFERWRSLGSVKSN